MKKFFLPFFTITLLLMFASVPNFSTAAQDSAVNLQVVSVDSTAFPKVKLTFSVSDPQGFPIKSLEKASFAVSEDNKAISDFSMTPFVNTEMPLAIALVLDTSGSMTSSLPNSVAAAKEFIKTLGPNDQVVLIAFKEKPMIIQELTTDRALLNQALDSLSAVGDSALFDSLVEAVGVLKPRTERKVVVVITDGYETGVSSFSFDQVVDEAVRWSTHLYPIGIGGVQLSNLEKLAKLTGGFAQINPDSSVISEAFSNVLENLRNQYLLEYTSTLQADGTEHDVLITYKYPDGSAVDGQRFVATPGSIDISFPDIADGQEVSGNVLFSPSILAPATIRELDIKIDSLPITKIYSTPFEFVWDSSVVETGSHVVDFTVTDTAGNVTTKSIQLNVVPAVSVSSNLVADQPVVGKFSIPLEVKAARGIAKVEFFVDQLKVAEDTELPYEFDWDTRSIRPGYHEVRFVATDLENNIGESQLRVNVEIQKNNNLIWLAFITLLVAIGVILPIARRKNRSTRNPIKPVAFSSGESGKIASLVEKEGLEPGKVWKLQEQETRLGRKKDENDVPLKGMTASRFHAVINPGPDGFVLQTMHVENPVYVNGMPITEHITLKNGDVIKAGESEFLFEV
jgi:VWFA-related protein